MKALLLQLQLAIFEVSLARNCAEVAAKSLGWFPTSFISLCEVLVFLLCAPVRRLPLLLLLASSLHLFHTTFSNGSLSHIALSHTTLSHTTLPHTTLFTHTQLYHTQLFHTALWGAVSRCLRLCAQDACGSVHFGA